MGKAGFEPALACELIKLGCFGGGVRSRTGVRDGSVALSFTCVAGYPPAGLLVFPNRLLPLVLVPIFNSSGGPAGTSSCNDASRVLELLPLQRPRLSYRSKLSVVVGSYWFARIDRGSSDSACTQALLRRHVETKFTPRSSRNGPVYADHCRYTRSSLTLHPR